MLSGNKKIIISEELFSSVLTQFKKYHPLETWYLIIWAFSIA